MKFYISIGSFRNVPRRILYGLSVGNFCNLLVGYIYVCIGAIPKTYFFLNIERPLFAVLKYLKKVVATLTILNYKYLKLRSFLGLHLVFYFSPLH